MKKEEKFPLVSIGVPIVKSDFLEKCIKCILNQTYSNIEVIIINNASDHQEADAIEAILTQFSDKRIRYFRNDLQISITENWNRTLFLSKGIFFAILCDDDYWEPDFIETMILLAIKYHRVNIFHCRCLIINEKDEPINLSPICPEYEDVADFIYYRIKGFRMQYLSDFFVRAYAIKKIDGFLKVPDGWGSDDLTWFRLSLIGGIVYSSKILYHYRETQVSITSTMEIKNKILATEIFVNQINDILGIINESVTIHPILPNLILKEIKDFKRRKLISYRAEYLKKKFMLNYFLYVIVLFVLKLRYKITKHY